MKSNIFDKENDIKHLKEQIRRVDQQLEHDMQVQCISISDFKPAKNISACMFTEFMGFFIDFQK